MTHPAKSEHGEQTALFEWAGWMHNQGKYPGIHLMYAIPNVRASETERVYLAAEGVKAGVPDICLPVARGGFHGVYIELKKPGGRPTKDQVYWIEELAKQGYFAAVCVGYEDAKGMIEYYYTLEGRQDGTERNQAVTD